MTSLRLKDLGRWYSGGTPPRERPELWEGEVPWISAKDIDSTRLRAPTSFITQEAALEHSRMVPAHALLLIVRGMALAHGLPVVETDTPVAFNQDLRALVCAPGTEPRFVYYSLIGHRWRLNAHIDRAAHGTARVTDSVYGEQVWVPDQPEQSTIAAFLDGECARIDALLAELDGFETGLIDAERRLIDDLLPSGPRLRLGWLAAVRTGLTLGKKYGAVPLVERPYLRVANVQADRIDLGEVKTVRVPPSEAENYALFNGDVLMTEGGDMDKLGRGAVWQGEIDSCLHQNHVFAVRARPHDLSPDYLALATRSSVARRYFESTAVRSTNLASTSSSKVRAFRLPTPSLTGQAAILHEYRQRSRPLARLRRDLGDLAASIIEYRDSLITEAVMGQLDVPRLSDGQTEESLDAVRLGERPELLAS